MQFEYLPADIFDILKRQFEIDLRIIRLVSRAFRGLPTTGMLPMYEIMACIRDKLPDLARWYYEQVDKTITVDTLTTYDAKFTSLWNNHFPLYLLYDHPELAIHPFFTPYYMRMLGIDNYITMARGQSRPNLDSPRLQHTIACEFVHGCRSVTQLWNILTLVIDHWHAPKSLIAPIISNADFRNQLSEWQIHGLILLTLCRGDYNIYKDITCLYKFNKCAILPEFEQASKFITGIQLSVNTYIDNLKSGYSKIEQSDVSVIEVITPTYAATIAQMYSIF